MSYAFVVGRIFLIKQEKITKIKLHKSEIINIFHPKHGKRYYSIAEIN